MAKPQSTDHLNSERCLKSYFTCEVEDDEEESFFHFRPKRRVRNPRYKPIEDYRGRYDDEDDDIDS